MARTNALPTALARATSTLATASTAAPASARAASTSAQLADGPHDASGAPRLDWQTYLAQRKSKRRTSMVTCVPGTIAGASVGGAYFASVESDPTQLIMGLEVRGPSSGASERAADLLQRLDDAALCRRGLRRRTASGRLWLAGVASENAAPDRGEGSRLPRARCAMARQSFFVVGQQSSAVRCISSEIELTLSSD